MSDHKLDGFFIAHILHKYRDEIGLADIGAELNISNQIKKYAVEIMIRTFDNIYFDFDLSDDGFFIVQEDLVQYNIGTTDKSDTKIWRKVFLWDDLFEAVEESIDAYVHDGDGEDTKKATDFIDKIEKLAIKLRRIVDGAKNV